LVGKIDKLLLLQHETRTIIFKATYVFRSYIYHETVAQVT